MSEYINVGVRGEGSKGIPTKKALKQAVAECPANVFAYGTSDFTPYASTIEELQEGIRLSVCGPDPYNSRKWFATIERKNGKLVVS